MRTIKAQEMKRYHVFTKQGRKIVWAVSSAEAKGKVEAHGLAVMRVTSAPNPLADMDELIQDAGVPPARV